MPEELDVNSISNSIGEELFGKPTETNFGEAALAGEASPPPNAVPAGAASPSPVPEDIPMPKAWKKEMETHWATLSPDVRKYVQTREGDVLKGFEQYSTGHKRWSSLVEPFNDVLQKHPNVDPVTVMQGLMRNHLVLLQANPEQKRALAQQLLKSYGIDLGGIPAASPAPGQPIQLPPEVQSKLAEVDQIKNAWAQFQAGQEKLAVAENLKVVNAFASDPKNKYFEEVADDIKRFLETRAADSLESAYELACYANPAVRAKIIAEQAVPSPNPVGRPPKNVNGSGEGTPRNSKPETIADTINSVVQKHYGPH